MTLTAPFNLIWAVLLTFAFVKAWQIVQRRAVAQAYEYSHLPFLEGVVADDPFWPRTVMRIMAAGVALIGFALAGPHVNLRLPLSDGTVVVCVDTSGSMASTDVTPTRADAAINAVHQFVRELGPSVQVGLVSFSTDAQVNLQPTADRGAISDAIDTIPKPNGATAIGDALNLAASVLPSGGRRAIVLITDGVNNRGNDPLEVAHDLGNHHIPVYTIGIATNNAAQLPAGGDDQASADPEALRQISETTGGTTAFAGDAGAITRAFSNLARSTIWEIHHVDASIVCAVLGAACLVAGFFIAFGLGKIERA